MSESIRIGKFDYTKIALEREIRWLLHESAMGMELHPEGFEFMRQVLMLHPRAAGKIGCGLAGIRVIASKYGNRCFEVVRTDGSTEPFSVSTCLGKKKKPEAQRPEELYAWFDNPDYERMQKD